MKKWLARINNTATINVFRSILILRRKASARSAMMACALGSGGHDVALRSALSYC
jgi:hypothetical protein